MFPADLPPVSNKALYAYRVLMKWLSFFIFGLGSMILTVLVFPPMRLFLHPRDKFSKYARRFISFSMRGFIAFMHIIGIVDFEAENKKELKEFSSKIIAANHPSILDTVVLLALFPNADCIATSYLNRGILQWIIRQLYILSSLDFNDLLKKCTESLDKGNCLIIFPEGTRTPRSGNIKIKKGTARIALASGRSIVPLHIGGTDKFGLGKKDPWAGFNPRERYVYRISMGAEIPITHYQTLSAPAAVRALTKDITESLFPSTEKQQ